MFAKLLIPTAKELKEGMKNAMGLLFGTFLSSERYFLDIFHCQKSGGKIAFLARVFGWRVV